MENNENIKLVIESLRQSEHEDLSKDLIEKIIEIQSEYQDNEDEAYRKTKKIIDEYINIPN